MFAKEPPRLTAPRTDKGLLSRIYKELLKEKMGKENEQFVEQKILNINKHIKWDSASQ